MPASPPQDPARTRRNVTLGGRRTSVSLEPAIWDALFDICGRERLTPLELFRRLDRQRGRGSLASAVRVFVLHYYRARAGQGLARSATPEPSPGLPPTLGPGTPRRHQ